MIQSALKIETSCEMSRLNSEKVILLESHFSEAQRTSHSIPGQLKWSAVIVILHLFGFGLYMLCRTFAPVSTLHFVSRTSFYLISLILVHNIF